MPCSATTTFRSAVKEWRAAAAGRVQLAAGCQQSSACVAGAGPWQSAMSSLGAGWTSSHTIPHMLATFPAARAVGCASCAGTARGCANLAHFCAILWSLTLQTFIRLLAWVFVRCTRGFFACIRRDPAVLAFILIQIASYVYYILQ